MVKILPCIQSCKFIHLFLFSCPAGMPQDCPARRVRICRPFRGKGPSTCSKGKTGACVLKQATARRTARDPGPLSGTSPSPDKKITLRFRKNTALPGPALRTPPIGYALPHKEAGRAALFLRERKRASRLASHVFPLPPSGLRHGRPPCAPPTAGRCAAILRADAPCISALPEAQNKKRRCRNTVFFCSTRREPGENIRARSCRTFRRGPAPRNICCARGRTCTPCPPAADSLPCRPSPSSF